MDSSNSEEEIKTKQTELYTGKYKRRKDKQRAESQFNFNAPPVKLNTFLSSIAPVEPNRIDTTVEPHLDDSEACVLDKVNLYPSNSDELALGVYELSDTICDLIDVQDEYNCKNLDLDVIDENYYQITEQVSNNKIRIAGKDFKANRMSEPLLTAKRLRVKSLQLFSFNENYSKHFTIDPGELRSLNVDMMFDESEESERLLNRLSNLFAIDLGIKTSVLSYLKDLKGDENFYKLHGYALLLSKIKKWHLRNFDKRLSDYYPQLKDTVFRTTTTRMIFNYFGLMKFGEHKCLNDQLNYIHLIKNYLHQPKHSTKFKIFANLDIRSSYYNSDLSLDR